MTADQAAIYDSLATCFDPELGMDIVSLGLIYGVAVHAKSVDILMTLTTPGCPLIPYFQQEIEAKVKKASGKDEVVITVTFDPPWTPGKMSSAAKQQLALLR